VDDIDQRLVKLKQQIASARTPAAKNAAKAQATRLLKQKRMYMSQLDQVGAQQLNLESANFMTQQMKDTADQVHTPVPYFVDILSALVLNERGRLWQCFL
jgi:Snf7